MPVTTTNLTANFTGDGVTVTFPFTFALQQASDLTVYLAGVLQANTLYAVNINANGVGGTISFTTAPTAAIAGFMQRVIPVLQLTSLTNEGDIPSITLTNIVDRLTMIDQQLSFSVGLSLSLPASQAGIVSLVLPVPAATQFLQWNGTATALVNASLSPTSTLGPGTTTANAVALWNSTNGTLLGQVTGTGNSGQVLTSPGAGGAPTWTTPGVGAAVPSGSIFMFYSNYGGNAVPSGYFVCDGTNGTPNLIGMIPMGTQLSTGSQAPNAAGYGAQTNNTTVGSITHTHSLSVTGSGSGTTAAETTYDLCTAGTGNLVAVYAHVHSFSLGFTSTGTSGTQSVNAPACYAICFIMKS